MKIRSAEELAAAAGKGTSLLFPGKPRIQVGMSTCCIAKGADITKNALQYTLQKKNIDADIVAVGCTGLCSMEPTVEVQLPGKPAVIYGRVTEEAVPKLVEAIDAGTVAADLAIVRMDSVEHPLSGTITYGSADGAFAAVSEPGDLEFLKLQNRLLLRNAGSIDPENIYEYIARGGYTALASALTKNPDDVVQAVVASGLRGRGGGGFPTGRKWEMCRQAPGTEKYLICNVSEGEPGIGMHRSFLESDPHAVLEGLIIGAHAIGAATAYVYIRDNYRLALQRFRRAVAEAEELGLLGEGIMGSDLNLTVKVKEGGGRFVCGEETSLIACIEGRIGEPRQRPPFPIQNGLFGKPTCINNVETWANIPLIIAKGADWYAALGSDSSKGTKVISLTGNITRSGMVEVTMGTSLRDLISVIGGGVTGGKQLKGIQTGGPSGGVLPAQQQDLSVDYEELKNAGSMLGSGGMVIMDDDTDMVKIARYFTDFFVQESCGKCTPCREGVCRMCAVLDEVLAGRATEADLEKLTAMAAPITKASACALGKTAPVPILSTLQHFRADYRQYLQK